MSHVPSQWIRNLSVILLAILLVIPASLFAQNAHVVSPSDLQQQAASASQSRARDAQKVRDFLGTPAAQKALRDARIDPVQVKNAVAGLTDAELAKLAARADKAQHDFAAGYLSTLDIALIVLGVALIIIIIVVVK
jgi:hypothetical protein